MTEEIISAIAITDVSQVDSKDPQHPDQVTVKFENGVEVVAQCGGWPIGAVDVDPLCGGCGDDMLQITMASGKLRMLVLWCPNCGMLSVSPK